MEILRTDHRQREKVDIGWHYFAEMAVQKRLTAAETDVLKRIVEAGRAGQRRHGLRVLLHLRGFPGALPQGQCLALEKDEHLYALLRGLRVKLGYAHLPSEIPIGSTRQLEEGMTVTLAGRRGPSCRGRVAEVGESHWAVALDEDIPPTIAAGAAVDASLLRANDGEYAARLTISGTRLGSRAVYLPAYPGPGAQADAQLGPHRREHPLPGDGDVQAGAARTGSAEAAEHIQGPTVGMVLEGRLLDLSGGGACARFPSPIPQGHQPLPELRPARDLPARGAERGDAHDLGGPAAGREDFEHNLKFLSMETAFQEKIVRYVFEKQRIDSHLRGPTPVL